MKERPACRQGVEVPEPRPETGEITGHAAEKFVRNAQSILQTQGTSDPLIAVDHGLLKNCQHFFEGDHLPTFCRRRNENRCFNTGIKPGFDSISNLSG